MLNRYILDFLRVTQQSAIAAHRLSGRGDKISADRVAVESMRENLNRIDARIKVVIGEGERDKAPMLYVGEILGKGKYELDLAVDPLEGTELCASLKEGAIAVLGFAESGTLLHAPDVYMEKIYTPYECDINLENSVKDNLSLIADAKGIDDISGLTVTVLSRPRNEKLVHDIRAAGARVKLISDGDICAILGIILKDDADVYMGSGGAPEGVLSAIVACNLGGMMQGKLLFQNEEQKVYAKKLGISDLEKVYTHLDMVSGDAIFIATGVTTGLLLDGVSEIDDCVECETIVITPSGFHKGKSTMFM